MADFNALLIDSVDETVREVLGAKATSALWRHYEAYLGITRDEIPHKLPMLFESLRGVFGVGGDILGQGIVRRLYMKARVPLLLIPNRKLEDYVEELKRILAETS
ncbi:MAG TPA: hypothetical protein VLV18_04985 [Terriglobales bacterium]|nr:hypothetical protein [Terriglobales bacterium]